MSIIHKSSFPRKREIQSARTQQKAESNFFFLNTQNETRKEDLKYFLFTKTYKKKWQLLLDNYHFSFPVGNLTFKRNKSEYKTLSTETDKLRASQKETNQQMKEYDKRFEKTRKLFETQWGKLVESLVEGKLVEMLKARGIEVRQTSQRVEVCYTKQEGGIQKREFDILAVNGTEVVTVEVKNHFNTR